MTKEKLLKRFDELSGILLEKMNREGFWTGRLSSSALGVAVAVAALHFHDEKSHENIIRKGLNWLQDNINRDGSFGDTPESQGNVSTSLLVYSALNLYSKKNESIAILQKKTGSYLKLNGIDVASPQVSKAILEYYKKDFTFSVPILTMCGICGIPDNKAFNDIPQLPFELVLFPAKIYRFLNLSVVSYAIPALVAVGILLFKKKNSNALIQFIRKHAIQKSLEKLARMVPKSGGFLEAVPLTAFVSLSLVEAGYRNSEIVKKGIEFLKSTQRKDGSWPIDTDLSTWVTTLAVKAIHKKVKSTLSGKIQADLINHLLTIQNRRNHPFNGSRPGGWGWTSYSGSVPDGDDTPGAILALLRLHQNADDIKNEILAAGKWLIRLQNADGGFPTFSRGWGKLPFDKSCSDLTGHSFLALSAIVNTYGARLSKKEIKKYRHSLKKALKYLENNQRENGSWLPLWFGNQMVADHTNPVYGTSRVIAYLREASNLSVTGGNIKGKMADLITAGEKFLLSVVNVDGSWGGDGSVSGSMEETALAVSALPVKKYENICIKGLEWLDNCYLKNGLKTAPIGLYFASLWYSEEMYPLTAYIDALSGILEQFD